MNSLDAGARIIYDNVFDDHGETIGRMVKLTLTGEKLEIKRQSQELVEEQREKSLRKSLEMPLLNLSKVPGQQIISEM